MSAIRAMLPVLPPWDSVAWILLISWMLLLLFGFVFGRAGEDNVNRIPRPVRMLSSVILVVCSLIWWRGAGVVQLGPAHLLLFLGMLLSFIGDIAMSGLVRGKQQVWPGMVAFGVAHVLYILAIGELRAINGLGEPRVIALVLAVILVLGVLTWWFVIRSPSQSLSLNIASLAYCSLLTTMSGLALGGALGDTRLAGMAVGSLLFVASDALVGYRVIRGRRFRLIGDLTWITYIVGQLLIVLSPGIAFGMK